MDNINAQHKVINGYYHRYMNARFVDALTMIIIKYLMIPEHLDNNNHGDHVICHEDDYTISYFVTDDYLPWEERTQSAYGWVEMWPECVDAEWKFQYALPQQPSSFYIGITNVDSFKNTNPHNILFTRDDIYLGFQIIPQQRASRFNRFEINKSGQMNHRYTVMHGYTVDSKRMIYGEGYFRVKSNEITDLIDFTESDEEIPKQCINIEATVELVGLNVEWDNNERRIHNTDRLNMSQRYTTQEVGMRLLLCVSIPMGGSFTLLDYNFFGDISGLYF